MNKKKKSPSGAIVATGINIFNRAAKNGLYATNYKIKPPSNQIWTFESFWQNERQGERFFNFAFFPPPEIIDQFHAIAVEEIEKIKEKYFKKRRESHTRFISKFLRWEERTR